MFIAHLPAGYLTAQLVPEAKRTKAVTACALVGSVLPDLDLIYFYLPLEHGGGGRQIGHHHYWSHTPFWWLLMAGVVFGGLLLLNARRPLLPMTMLFGNALVHHLLDTPMGGIRWQWPLSSALIEWVDVPARYEHWILSFVLHESFLIELALVGTAVLVWWRRRPRAAPCRSAADHPASSHTRRSDPSAAAWRLPDRSVGSPTPASGPTQL
jgi:inner membrane protein